MFRKIEIENIGPIEYIQIDFPRNQESPIPLVIVGENGAGKSILLSHLVNSLIVGKQDLFDDVEVEKGKVFKYRSPHYIKSEKDFSFSSVEFDSGAKVQEWQLLQTKSDFEKNLGYTPIYKEWGQIPGNESSQFITTFKDHGAATDEMFKKQCSLYFPVNRYEDPAWLNVDNLTSRASYTELKHVSGYSNRSIICTSPLKANKNWLLDLIFDRQAFEIQAPQVPFQSSPEQPATMVNLFAGFSGKSTNIYNAVIEMLKIILREKGNIRLGVGTRKNRQISVMRDEKTWVPNLFQLSTGEVQLLNLFLSIVRDYDLSEGDLSDLSDIKGMVIVDEIDSHLHTIHQKEVLPELIKSLPNVQFIITTHSPLFLIGMEEKFGEDGFDIINMPDGQHVVSSDFSEFTAAYVAFKETAKHREEIRKELEQHYKPIVFVEGDYDVRYITKAAEILGKSDVLERVQLKDGDGYGNLDKIWKGYNNHISEVIPCKMILLYDCDTRKSDTDKNLVYKRVIPTVEDNPIKKGIENIFSSETIDKIEQENPRFIDYHEEAVTRVRGENIITPSYRTINNNEKRNMCDWLCENGDADDFSGFESIFHIIEEITASN